MRIAGTITSPPRITAGPASEAGDPCITRYGPDCAAADNHDEYGDQHPDQYNTIGNGLRARPTRPLHRSPRTCSRESSRFGGAGPFPPGRSHPEPGLHARYIERRCHAHRCQDRPPTLRDVPTIAGAAERLGFDGTLDERNQSRPVSAQMALAAAATARITVGTAVALAFTRSPTTLAHTAWDLGATLGRTVQARPRGRGGRPYHAAIRPHADPPAPKLREVIGAIREVWRAWDVGDAPAFRGRYFNISLMTPLFHSARPNAARPVYPDRGHGPADVPARRRGRRRFPHSSPAHTPLSSRSVVPEIDAA